MIFGHNINKYYLRFFYMFLIGIATIIFIDITQLEIPDIIGDIVDSLGEGALTPLTKEMLNGFIVKMIIIAIIMLVGRFLWRITIFGVAVLIEADLRDKMFCNSLTLSQEFYQENKTGVLMALYTNDIRTIRQSFGMGIVMLVDAVFLGGLAFYKMFVINWQLTLISSIPLLILASCGGVIGKAMDKKFTAKQKAYEDLSDFTQENFSGITVIKAFVKEGIELLSFSKINKDNVDKDISFVRYSTILWTLVGLLINCIGIIIIGYGSFLVMQSKAGNVVMTPGELTKFFSYFSTLTWPMMAIAQLINLRSQAKASLKRIDRIIDKKPDIVDKDIYDKYELSGKITFKNLSFKYPDGTLNALHDISVDIDDGQMVGVIGRTGCGKTTLVDLLLRVYNIPDGMLFINGYDIMHLPFKEVRGLIGYVPQDNFLFSDTVKNNINFKSDKTMDDIIHAAEFSDVDENIREFDKGYDTILGERGVTMSGGQKQRTAISRAIINNPKILILDDSVSAVDTKTEERIISNLRKERKGKTTLLIAHRISTVKSLDKVILMDEGTIVGYGTHDELLETSPLYQEMVHLQKLEDEVGGEIDD